MANSTRVTNPGVVEATTDGSPSPTPLDPPVEAINDVLAVTSLNTHAGQPSRLANLGYSNFVANTDRCTQNAVANQQAHGQVALSALTQALTNVQNLGPLEARVAAEVLTDNSLADALASLRAVLSAFSGGSPLPPIDSWSALIRALRRLAREVELINAVNSRLTGTGRFEDPYVMAQGPIFVAAPMTIGFPGVPASQVHFQVESDGVKVTG